MKKIRLITIVLCFIASLMTGHVYAQDSANAPDCHSIDDLSRGNIREFKDAYIPVEYHALPEYMSFVDLGILLLLLGLGLFFVLKRKTGRPMHILMIFTFVYLALIRGGCICPVGAITNATMGIVEPALVSMTAFVVFIGPMLIALVGGRVFCSSGCPMGSLQHLGKAKKHKKWIRIPKTINNILKAAPVIILLLTIYFAANGSACFFACELDPYKAIFFTGQSWFEQALAYIMGQPMESKILLGGLMGTWIYMSIMLVVGYFIPRPFCRFICPYSVLLGLVSMFAIKRRTIKENNCVYCGLCQKVCPVQAITIDRTSKLAVVSNYDCIQCNKCNESCKKDAIS